MENELQKTDAENIFGWLKTIVFKEKTIFVTVVIGVLATCATFAYNNFSFPKDGKRIDVMQSHIQSIEDRTNNRDIEILLMQKDICTGNKNMDDFKSDTKNSLKEIRDMIFESSRIIKKIKIPE